MQVTYSLYLSISSRVTTLSMCYYNKFYFVDPLYMYLFKLMAVGYNSRRQFCIEAIGNMGIIVFVLNPAFEYLEKN